jgi:Holliday junction DNA helicase RuvA
MISFVEGVLTEKSPSGQVVLACGGLGYEVYVSANTFCSLPELGQTLKLLTHFVVREDAQLLYGFLTEQERASFRNLIKISGVGARTALSILSGISSEDLAQAVVQQDVSRLVKVPGVGKKTAERLLLELKGKLQVEGSNCGATVVGTQSFGSVERDVIQALQSLGYSEKDMAIVVKKMPADLVLEQGIRWALQQLAS